MSTRGGRWPERTLLPTTAEVMAAHVRETRQEMGGLRREFQELLTVVAALTTSSQRTVAAVRGGRVAQGRAAKTQGLREGLLRAEIARLKADNAELHRLLNGETEELLGDFAQSLKRR